jgi:hypothetical protein
VFPERTKGEKTCPEWAALSHRLRAWTEEEEEGEKLQGRCFLSLLLATLW